MVVLATAWASSEQAEQTGAAAIEFTAEVIDFGQVRAGEVVPLAFTFKNPGLAVLELTAVRPGCGCTTAGQWTRVVAPGGTGSIPIQFDTRSFDGTVTKKIQVSTTARDRPQVTLTLTGFVWNPFEVAPPSALFRLQEETVTTAPKVLRIRSRLDRPVELVSVESSSPSFEVETRVVVEGREFELQVVPRLPMERSDRAMITVKTNALDFPEFRIVAQTTFLPAVTVSPTQLVVSRSRPDTAWQSSITVRALGRDPLKIIEATSSLEGADLKVTEIQAGRVFRVTLVVPPGREWLRELPAAIVIKTSHPKYSEIRIPLVAKAALGLRSSTIDPHPENVPSPAASPSSTSDGSAP